ncbi:hypothetical protein T4E_11604 [Trichinella pseudospiralis]|uniref:Uncharacterized protein n=1 Tax=Trichinella pseudospiralis TaxID=6337 RepID=A0A0V0YJJ0_TRIPS|nr:hypothetical protein T4E_11604 [Trichinella pseudospiralis]
MAFRLKNVPATFQRFMKIALAELKCLICLNVIIIFGRTPEQHLYVTVGTCGSELRPIFMLDLSAD